MSKWSFELEWMWGQCYGVWIFLLQFGATDNSLNNVWFFQNKPSRKRIYSYFKWCDRQLEKITVRNPKSIFLLILIVIFKNFCRNVPDNYKILFMQGGGTAQFAAVPLNLLRPEKTVCDPSLLCKRMWISCFFVNIQTSGVWL